MLGVEQEANLAKAGRKRKHDAKRKPCGRIATPGPSERVDANKAVVLTQRYRRDVLNRADKPELAGSIGKAFVLGTIDEYQAEAANEYNAIVRRYASMKGLPLPTLQGQVFDRADGAGSPLGVEPNIMRAVEAEYDAAFQALNRAGFTAIREVNSVAVHDNDVSAPYFLRFGLDALVRLWGLKQSPLGKAPISVKIKKWRAADAKPTDREDLRKKEAS